MSKFFVLLLLVACSSIKSKMIKGPDGSEHQLVSCAEVEDCYNKAAELCGTYKIVNTSTDTWGSDGNTYSGVKLLVKCNERVTTK